VKVNAPAPGLRLETSRVCVPGWAALVNRGPARTGCSADGYLTVELLEGRNAVELRYQPPPAVRYAFWVTVATLAAALVSLIRRAPAPVM
jgi:hypothetical protein